MDDAKETGAIGAVELRIPARLAGRAVEHAAVAWVRDYEQRAGRHPIDRRYEREFPADLESTDPTGARRLIEIKATATTYRGWFLPLEPVQFKHAGTNPEFFVYVVENVGQGDPAGFTLRILDPEHLRRLVGRHAERHHFEVTWPSADHDCRPASSWRWAAAPRVAVSFGALREKGTDSALNIGRISPPMDRRTAWQRGTTS